MLVMVVDDLLGVVHAAVTKFDGVPIEDFPKWVVYRKVFIYKGEEFVADVGADIFAVWRVVPEYVVPLSVSSVRGRGWFVFEGVVVSAVVECFLVWGCCLVERGFVR